MKVSKTSLKYAYGFNQRMRLRCVFFLKTIKGFVNLAFFICQLVFGFHQLQFQFQGFLFSLRFSRGTINDMSAFLQWLMYVLFTETTR